MSPLDHRLNRIWNWPEVAFLVGMGIVGFWLVWLALAVQTGGF